MYEAHLSILLDPFDPEVIRSAREEGISDEWIKAAQKSPVYKMVVKWGVALPLHPEFRTLPMVWYVPPLSPILRPIDYKEGLPVKVEDYISYIEAMRIPIEYLASMFTAGNTEVVKAVLLKLITLRSYMGSVSLGEPWDSKILGVTGLTVDDLEEMGRLFAVAKYEERFVIPTAMRESVGDLSYLQGARGFEELAPPTGEIRAWQIYI